MSRAAYEAVLPPPERDEIHRLLDVVHVVHDADAAFAQNRDHWSDVEVIVSGWGVPVLDETVLEKLPSLRAIFHTAGTVKSFVTDAVWARGISVTSAALANAQPVAEFTCAQIVLALKRVWPRVFAIREERRYETDDAHAVGAFGSTVGLLALSKIGRLVREQLRQLDVQVIAYDPTVSSAVASELEIELVSLDEVFARSHVVSCHLPLLPETRGLVRGRHFARMRPGAAFINTARGEIVREAEMADALAQRPDLWALLDVTVGEFPSLDEPLFRLPNVVLTPHIAGSIGLECRRMSRMMLDEIGRYLRREPLVGEVLREQLPMIA